MASSKNKATKAKARIVLVDDHPVVRQGFAQLINQTQDFHVCGEAGDAPSAMATVKETRPDLTIVDLSLEATSGLDLIQEIKTHHPKLPVLVLSMHDETLYAERALRAGARGYVMKDKPIQEIMGALHQVLAGEIYLSSRMSGRLLQRIVSGTTNETDSLIGALSNRELQVFELIGQGHGTRDIAEKLHLSVKTIDTHRENIKRKLHLSDAIELHQQAFLWMQRLPADGKQTALR